MYYLGSKRALLPFIEDAVTQVAGKNFNVFCDMFAGTGVVGAHFKQKGYEVIANDLQFASYTLNRALLGVGEMRQEKLEELQNLTGIEGFIYNNYCETSGDKIYFSVENAKKIDAIRTYLKGEFGYRDSWYCYLASLINAADKVANISGQYSSHLKHHEPNSKKPLKLEYLESVTGPRGDVYNTDAAKLIHYASGDVLYLDPPYTHKQYSANYHLLDTIALYDNPETKDIRGLRKDAAVSDFCLRRNAAKALEYLIANADFRYIFVSYSNMGIIDTETVRQILEKYGKYERFEKDHKIFVSNKIAAENHKGKRSVEYIHVCIK